jgi:hypothetical protein
MPTNRSSYALTPARRESIENQRQFLMELDEADPVALAAALAALDPDVVSDDDVEQDEFHLAREYRRRK